jgi:hypothetical protein
MFTIHSRTQTTILSSTKWRVFNVVLLSPYLALKFLFSIVNVCLKFLFLSLRFALFLLLLHLKLTITCSIYRHMISKTSVVHVCE